MAGGSSDIEADIDCRTVGPIVTDLSESYLVVYYLKGKEK
jgi:hypothetical protein